MAIKPKSTITVRLNGKGTSHSRSEITLRDLTNVIDEPVERGGTNEGFSPTETAYAALVGCTNVIGHKCAQSLGADIGNLSFAMEVDFDRRGVMQMAEVEVPFVAVRLAVTSDGSCTQQELDAVAVDTAKYCAISKMFENSGTKLTITWTKA